MSIMVLPAAGPPALDFPLPMNAAEIQLGLQKLNVLGRVLYIAAHPDDENTNLIALWANGSLKQPVALSCVSCLEKFNYEIKVPAFALHTELHGPETVDLTPFMREDILLNLPAHPRCDREGARVCKAASATLNIANESEAKREHDWEALDKLKLKR
jgi:uncharacterized metal-binding protein YceD (DUF177 family)